jgi:hypothetical protein
MITSNAGAEFTTKTTIIVVLVCRQRENMAISLTQIVVLQRSNAGGALNDSPKADQGNFRIEPDTAG